MSDVLSRVQYAQKEAMAEAPVSCSSHNGIVEIAFNYISRHRALEGEDSIFTELPHPATQSADLSVSHRSAIFEVVAHATEHALEVRFTYDLELEHQDRIRDWIRLFFEELEISTVN
jgi:hypothetical protein